MTTTLFDEDEVNARRATRNTYLLLHSANQVKHRTKVTLMGMIHIRLIPWERYCTSNNVSLAPALVLFSVLPVCTYWRLDLGCWSGTTALIGEVDNSGSLEMTRLGQF
jgi:hypothetical protein